MRLSLRILNILYDGMGISMSLIKMVKMINQTFFDKVDLSGY